MPLPKPFPTSPTRLSVDEAASLRNTINLGGKPYSNLIQLGFAAQDQETSDWYVTDAGYEMVRRFTQANPTHYQP